MEFQRKVHTHDMPVFISGHSHPMFMCKPSYLRRMNCAECGDIMLGYYCFECDFRLCYTCAANKGEYEGKIEYEIDDFKLVDVGEGVIGTAYHKRCLERELRDENLAVNEAGRIEARAGLEEAPYFCPSCHGSESEDSESEDDDESVCNCDACYELRCNAYEQAQVRREERNGEGENDTSYDESLRVPPEEACDYEDSEPICSCANDPTQCEAHPSWRIDIDDESQMNEIVNNLHIDERYGIIWLPHPEAQLEVEQPTSTEAGGGTQNTASYSIRMGDEETLDEDLRL
jgi:hypothetical protein